MLADQTSAQNQGTFGHLNVYAHYDRMERQLKIDVISAENLVPLDVNGLSDPFVVVRYGVCNFLVPHVVKRIGFV